MSDSHDALKGSGGLVAKPAPSVGFANTFTDRQSFQKDGYDINYSGYDPNFSGIGADPTITTMGTPSNAKGSIASSIFEPEDEYQKVYVGGVNSKGVLEPPYILRALDRICLENNALSPCIEAMVTNIARTGYMFTPTHGDETTDTEDAKTAELTEFFDEPWPGTNFTEQLSDMVRDRERQGNGYFEIIRNLRDEIVFLRHVDGKMMRQVKLDAPVVVAKKVMRKGVQVTLKTQVRERRYTQLLNGRTIVYFKELGASRDLDKDTGLWAPQGTRLPANKRATEILAFPLIPDAHTPYGLPRWISQSPSVVGSRKAEEFNLDFFDNGGVPPVLVLLQGGTLNSETRKAFSQGMLMGAKKANRVQVIEAEPSGGSIDSASNAKITVERFGHERQNDSMFEKYDDKCEQRVRRAFRLPPIFVGDAADYTFATAFASYTVAEAQVFKPERETVFTIISRRLLPAMGYQGYAMMGLPLRINDVASQLNALNLANKTNRVDPADLIEHVNNIAGLHLKVTVDPVLPWLVPGVDPITGNYDGGSVLEGVTTGPDGKPLPPGQPPQRTPGLITKASQIQGVPTGQGKGVTKGTKPPKNGTPQQTPSNKKARVPQIKKGEEPQPEEIFAPALESTIEDDAANYLEEQARLEEEALAAEITVET